MTSSRSLLGGAAGSRMLLAALLAAMLAVGLLACGAEENGDDNGSASAQTPTLEEETGSNGNGNGSFDTRRLYAEAAPGVVTVRSVFSSDNGDEGPLLVPPGGEGAGQGSGFVISDGGEIVTNAHVVTNGQASGGGGRNPGPVSEADEVFVEFADRNQVPAEIIGVDPNADVALLEVNPRGLDLNPLELGDSDEVRVGTPVAAIGSPFGQDQSISTGIVSATDRAIESLTQFRIDGAIQTDASINPGNSGGPLIAPDGDVIGVNQQISTTSGGNEGVGFAVPSNLVQRSIEDLRDDGEAEYAYLGVESIPLYPQLADELEIDAPSGAMVVRVTADSPASEADLQGAGNQTVRFQGREIETGGDVIVAVDGENLVDDSDLSRLISRYRPGDEIELEIIRNGDSETVDVTLQARPTTLPE